MNRRKFLEVASATGLVIPYWGLVPIANAQSAGYTGKILINVHAGGGLDASSWADPRERDPAMIVAAAAGTPAGVAGNIRYAPMGNNAAFFGRYFNQMLVINGVHSETNGHDDGTRRTRPAGWTWATNIEPSPRARACRCPDELGGSRSVWAGGADADRTPTTGGRDFLNSGAT
jgi:hypothetical protein